MYVESKDVALTDLDGRVVRKVLAYSENLMSVELHFDKGVVEAEHFYPRERIGYPISGSLLFQKAGKEDRVLMAGDTYYVESDVKHSVVAFKEIMLLDIFTPMKRDFV